VTDNEAEVRTLDLVSVGVQSAEESDVAIDIRRAVRHVPPNKLTSPRILRVVLNTAAEGLWLRNENLQNVAVIDHSVGVGGILVLVRDLPLLATGGWKRRVRLTANPCTANEIVARGELNSEELESTIDAVQARSLKVRGIHLRALIGITEVVTGVAVLALEVREGETLADCGVDRGHVINTLERVDSTTIVSELLVNTLKDAPSELAGSRGQREARRSGREVRSCDDLAAGCGDVLVLIGVRPDPLGILGQNTDHVLDLIFDLPCKAKVIQADVRAVEGGLLEAGRAEGDTEGIDVLTGDNATTTIGTIGN